jgi:hypothetical protein
MPFPTILDFELFNKSLFLAYEEDMKRIRYAKLEPINLLFESFTRFTISQNKKQIKIYGSL